LGELTPHEIADALSAAGGPRVGCALALTEISDTFAGIGGVTVRGTLALTELSDTLAATGTVLVVDPVPSGLVIHWSGSGGDLCGSGNIGTVYGGVTPTSGQVGNAAQYDGSTGYIAVNQVINIGRSRCSPAIRPTVKKQLAGFADGFAASTTDKDLVLNADGTVSWYVYVQGGIWLSTTTTITDGNWHHVVGSYEDGTLRIYIDNVLSASTPGYGGSFAGYSQPNVFLGGVGHQNAHGDDWYAGALDDFRTYNRAITATEVAALYHLGVPLPPPITGDLAAIETADTLVATGTILPVISGALSATQTSQTLAAAGGPRVGGTLTATQAAQTISAAGGVTVQGQLTTTESADTISASGGPRVGGTLAATQASQTLVAAGGPRVGGTLAAQQAANTLAATGAVTVRGTLSVVEAADTSAATGSVLTGATASLSLTQANQTLAATGTVPVVIGGALTQTQAPHTLAATGSDPL
jgi:hypothetical protein